MEDVILETSLGTIVCEMYYDHAPRTCKNFVELVSFNPATRGDSDTIGEAWILQWSHSETILCVLLTAVPPDNTCMPLSVIR
jgi:cyclophilin family peptidyl-prolyl cis-trans isomerase